MELLRILKTGAEIMLNDRIEKVGKDLVSARFLLGVGSPAEEIVSVANAENAEMIVIGSRRLKADKIITLGSVARKVSELADCPVLIIR